MNRYQLYHRWFAFSVFLFSFIIYHLTIAPTASFWDCGEFISCSYILGVPHPPGAPFYLLLGRLFSMLPLATDIGLRVNLISALTSALTVMFAYLIIVRLVRNLHGDAKKIEDFFVQTAGGVIGALCFAFSDSFWFNAVEAEVYAISMFFTALILWLILVWYEKADDPASDRYLFLISYCIGLAIGIHLLSILALPAVLFIIYHRKFSVRLSSIVIYLLVTIATSVIYIFMLKYLKNYYVAVIPPAVVIFLIFLLRKKNPDLFKFMLFAIIAQALILAIYPGLVKWMPNLALFTANFFSLKILVIGIFFTIFTLALILILSIKFDLRILFLLTACFLFINLGVSTYATIYLRSNLNPAINENDPENLENIVSYMNRDQYGDWSYINRNASLWKYQIEKMYLRYFGWQFIGKGTIQDAQGLLTETFSLRGLWALPFFFGLFGMIYQFNKDYRSAFAVTALFLITGFLIVLYLNQPNPQPRERDYVYVGSFFAFALWIGIGISALLEMVKKTIRNFNMANKIQFALVGILLLLLLPLKMLAFNYHSHDRSGNYVAVDYSYNLLQSCEPNAILFTNGDNDTFPLWFMQYVYKIRTDVRVVNLSLLNTKWYIYQLRDQEPSVPIHLRDHQIETLAPAYWPEKKLLQIPVPKEIYQLELKELEKRKEFVSKFKDVPPEISFNLGPTFMGQGIRVQDIMILEIIKANQFSKPIYFAITVSRENLLNLDDYLRMDGLTFRLVTYPGERISPFRLKENLLNKFRYQNLDNPKVYYDDNILGLLGNYRTAFYQLSNFYRQEKMYDSMLQTLEKMEQLIPQEVIPYDDRRFALAIGSMYFDAGQPQKFEECIDRILKLPHISNKEKFELAQIYFYYLQNAERAEEIVLNIIKNDSTFKNGYFWLFQFYLSQNKLTQAYELSEKIFNQFPDDKQAQELFHRMENLKQDTTRSITK